MKTLTVARCRRDFTGYTRAIDDVVDRSSTIPNRYAREIDKIYRRDAVARYCREDRDLTTRSTRRR
jgi:hypothetical protein